MKHQTLVQVCFTATRSISIALYDRGEFPPRSLSLRPLPLPRHGLKTERDLLVLGRFLVIRRRSGALETVAKNAADSAAF